VSEAALGTVLDGMDGMAIAVSGGVDSMTLAYLAHRRRPDHITMIHAASPAVPAEATARIRRYAANEGWRLLVVDAGETRDPRYVANPHDRCFWCKSNLYATIRGLTDELIVSGANLDDLGDYRPGLQAAADHGVRHPWIEAGIGKREIRRIAAAHALMDLAELPSSPCLSSRIETGIAVTVGALAAIDWIERAVRATLAPETLRCRLRSFGIEIELDDAALARVDRDEVVGVAQAIMAASRIGGDIRFAPYRRGSAFHRPAGQ
jgi:pyridinium-3,5-biscarboxylic acid mononucleotide sulfurtransferase